MKTISWSTWIELHFKFSSVHLQL